VSWCLLIIEDDVAVADALSEVFTMRGYRVRVVSHGRAALEVVRRDAFKPDAILLDLLMPVMSGLEFMAARAAEPLLASVPIIVTSAQPDLARESNVYALLGKPLSLGVLVDTVYRAVHRLPPNGGRRAA
jgi:CheY-like chemotaxis protein